MINYPDGGFRAHRFFAVCKFGNGRPMWNLETLFTQYPSGRIFVGSIPGTSCQATFIQSLRDKARLSLG
jgi:hypothetical protein